MIINLVPIRHVHPWPAFLLQEKKSHTIKQKFRKSQSGKEKAKTWKMAAALFFHQDSHKTP
jgi:hypothetical protein